MKLNITALLLLLTIFSFNTYGQAIVTKTDSIALGQDSLIKVTLQEARGNIQWQKSLNATNWFNLEDEINDTLLVKSDVEAIYRAVVTDGTCLPVFSDSVGVVTTDTLNTNLVNTKNLGLELVSDSIEISNGKYIYIGKDNTNALVVGKIIFDEQSGGTIRTITGITINGDTITVQTDQATMEELFYDSEFKLSTEMLFPSMDLKSASMSEISRILTDADGFIHPVEVTFRSSTGEILKSASIFNEHESDQDALITISLKGIKFFEKTFTDKKTNLQGKASVYISDGHFKYNPVFKYEFKYVPPSVKSWWPLVINSGYLEKAKFYTDNSLVEFKTILTLESEVSYSYEFEKTLIDNVIQASYTFAVGPVPVIIDIEIDLNCNLNIEIGGKVSLSRGFQNTNYVTVGAGYENRQWYTIKNINKTTQYFSDYKGSVQANVKFDVGPEATIKLYKIIGPTLYVGPFLEYGLNLSHNLNWDQSLDLGLLGKVGGEVEIFGKKLIPLPNFGWNFFKLNIWSSPNNLLLVEGNNQKAILGSELPNSITVKVTDKFNIPTPLVQVNFDPSAGTVSKNKVTTDINGLASTRWTLPDTAGKHTLKAYLLNGSDTQIEGAELTINAEALPKPDNTLTDARDGKVYKTVKIGDQTWMAENLAYLPSVSPFSEWSVTAPVYYVYNYNGTSITAAKATSNFGTYGVLYNWPAAKAACPAGWHLSTEEEWTKLENYLIANGFNYDGTTSGNKIAKSLAAQTSWLASTDAGAIGNNLTLNNKSGFSALPGGLGSNDGFFEIGGTGYWWSSAFDESSAWFRLLDYNYINLSGDTHYKALGFSVRCVRD
jgi:uncharacterized protein (TIGR02145 family)